MADLQSIRVKVKAALDEVDAAIAPPPGNGDPPPDQPNDPPLPAAMVRVKIADDAYDGPTEKLANMVLNIPWKTVGGDYSDASGTLQGTNHWVTVPPGAAPRTVNVVIPNALIEKLRLDPTGFYLSRPAQASSQPPWIASRNNADTTIRPKLTVVTTTGTFDCPITVDTYLPPQTAASQTGLTAFRTPGIVIPDLSAVTGTVTQATLTFRHTAYGGEQIYIDFLEMPELLTDPAVQRPASVVHGIANTVAKDADLKTHQAVLLYFNPQSMADVQSFFQWGSGGVEVVDWPEYGIKAFRVRNSQQVNTAVNRRNLWVDRPTGILNPLPWRMPYDQAPQKLYLRYLIKLENDVGAILNPPVNVPGYGYKTTSNWQGTKLPGLHGSPFNAYPDAANPGWAGYPANIRNGVYTSPEHGVPSIANNRAMGLQLYLYHEDHSLQNFYGNGDMRYTPLSWMPGRAKPYCIEIMVQLNTPGVADGVIELYMDGMLAYRMANIKWRAHDAQRLFSADMLVMHGGNGLPAATQHYQIGGWTVSKSYVGPPKKVA